MSNSGANFESLLPTYVSKGSKNFLNLTTFGAKSGEDCTEIIEAAQEEVKKLPYCFGLFFDEGEWLYSKTLLYKVPWVGIPRRSILKRTLAFTYSGLQEQFSILNANASTNYNSLTPNTVFVQGVDFEIEGTAESGKGSFGLANVSGGGILNCHFKTNGTNVVGALIDLYAGVKNFVLDVQCENLTQAKTGGNVWIRNLTSKPEEAAAQATENIYVKPGSRFLTTTADEAIAVFGVFGATKRVLIDGAILEAGASAEAHQRLASTFPSAIAEKEHAAVENVEWRKCTFIDTNNTIKENGEVLGIGRSTGTSYICQNIKHVDCTFLIKTNASKVVATRNIPSKFEGGMAGIKAIRPYINAEGSSVAVSCGILEYPTVEGGTVVGNILQSCKRCNTVSGGSWEATEKVFYDCNSVGADYRVNIPNTTGIVFYREANTGTWSGIASYGKGEITGGKNLLTVHNTVESGNIVNLQGSTITTSSETGNVIETPTEGSIPTVIIKNNTASGPKSLTRKGTFAQIEGNNWYGTTETISLAVESVTGEKLAKESVETEKIKGEAVTSAKLATGSATATKLGAESVESGKIKEGAVTETKLGAAAVTEAKLGAEAVAAGKVKEGAITETKIGASSVTETKLGTSAVTAAKLATGSVTEAKLGAEAVAEGKIKANAVSLGKLAAAVSKQIPAEHGRSAEMTAGEITISAPGTTATGAIMLTTEGGTAIGASVVERTAGTGFKVKATATSTDRVNWAVWTE